MRSVIESRRKKCGRYDKGHHTAKSSLPCRRSRRPPPAARWPRRLTIGLRRHPAGAGRGDADEELAGRWRASTSRRASNGRRPGLGPAGARTSRTTTNSTPARCCPGVRKPGTAVRAEEDAPAGPNRPSRRASAPSVARRRGRAPDRAPAGFGHLGCRARPAAGLTGTEGCAATGVADVIDVSVALCAHDRGHAVVTSDPDDIRAAEPSLLLLAPA